jgi:hypothetical protein
MSQQWYKSYFAFSSQKPFLSCISCWAAQPLVPILLTLSGIRIMCKYTAVCPARQRERATLPAHQARFSLCLCSPLIDKLAYTICSDQATSCQWLPVLTFLKWTCRHIFLFFLTSTIFEGYGFLNPKQFENVVSNLSVKIIGIVLEGLFF